MLLSECNRILATEEIKTAQEQVIDILYDQLHRDIARLRASGSTLMFLRRRADLYWRSLAERSGREFDPDAFIKKLVGA